MTKTPILTPASCTAPLPFDLKSPHLVGEEKIDGSRYVLYIGFDPYERRQGTTLLSKHESVADHKLVDRTENVPHIAKDYPDYWGTILDGETKHPNKQRTSAIMGSAPAKAVTEQEQTGWMVYHVWDVMFYKGQDVRSKSLTERRKLLEEVVAALGNEHIKIVDQVRGDLERFFQAVVARGGEGIVVKDLRRSYGVGWTKLKKSYDVSVIVMSTNPGKGVHADTIGSVNVGVYERGQLTEIAVVPPLGDDFSRNDLKFNFEKFRGRVVDIFAQEVTKISKKNPCGRIRHATFHRLRDDVTPETCTSEKMWKDLQMAIAHVSRAGREQKRRQTNYKKGTGRGDPDKWRKAAETVMARLHGFNQHLTALGLTQMPNDLKALALARNQAIRKAHPDLGGSHDDAAAINAAYEQLKKMF